MRLIRMLLLLTLTTASLTLMSCTAKTATHPPNPGAAITKPSNKDTVNIDVKISYKVILDDKVKNADPNIIKAARQGILDYDMNNARLLHYNYSISKDINIFEIKDNGNNTWLVKFNEKSSDSDSYNSGYSSVSVAKEESGSFKGYIANPKDSVIKRD